MERPLLPIFVLALLGACSGTSIESGNPGAEPGAGGTALKPGRSGAGGTGATTPSEQGGGTALTLTEPEALSAERAALNAELAELAGLDGAGLLERFPTSFQPAPNYDLATVQGLDLIQASSAGLSEAELAVLAGQGFVISGSKWYPSFAYGYSTIYSADLPLYVSADSILASIHSSYDAILKNLELTLLSSELEQLLDGMRAALAGGQLGALDAQIRADVDVYLAVAKSLLAGAVAEPVSSGDPSAIQELYALALAAQGNQTVELFGVARDEDFSQFEPRGHYTDQEELERYFRATMWLGRIDFRLLETQQNGSQLFRRRQFDAMLALHELVSGGLQANYDTIDRTIAAFVGEPDYMVLSQVGSLLADLGASSAADVAGLGDQQIAQAIVAGGYGTQRISSHIMINGLGAGTLPLSASFALLGQRYVLDSHVFSNVVYDRAGGGSVIRLMPNPLDVAFAALGNDQAAELLQPELETHAYAADLGAMRVLSDAHPAEFWQENLYNLWLGSLRTLAPRRASSAADASELPPVARSEAWGRRLLSAELSSWAELRHDTLLYAKQSYTGGLTCEFPDAYVDPYPEFFAAVQSYATKGADLVASLDLGQSADSSWLATRLNQYFTTLDSVAGRLREMAEHERSGAAFTAEMMEFINDAVVVDEGCGDPYLAGGWYSTLFFSPETALEFDPTIADVHTQPTDEGGNFVGRVLHVGTGPARLMVVIAEGCSGPRAYAGLSSSYFEHTTENFERISDEDWAAEFAVQAPSDVPWMSGLVVP